MSLNFLAALSCYADAACLELGRLVFLAFDEVGSQAGDLDALAGISTDAKFLMFATYFKNFRSSCLPIRRF